MCETIGENTIHIMYVVLHLLGIHAHQFAIHET